jgi:ubiquinone/menaquinone biosynthesis C-methylase UbiE
MHAFARRLHGKSGEVSATQTHGLILNWGWRYDLTVWFSDNFVFHGKLRELRQRTINLADIHSGESVLDVGCGTGALAIEAYARVGAMGRVCGIDPGTQQVARARAKAARRNMPIEFQIGVVEHLPFHDQTFDVVLSSLMMHHLPASLKRQGLAEIARVLKPGGRLVITDFKRPEQRQGQPGRLHAGGSDMQELIALVQGAGFSQVETEEVPVPGAVIVRAYKS